MPIGAMKFSNFATLIDPSFHPYTASWINRVATAGGTVTTARQSTVDIFIKGLITDGLLDGVTISNSILHYMNLFATDSFAGCNVPLIDAKSVGNSTLTNFVAGDYSISGLTGDSSTKYLNTNYSALTNLVSFADGGCIGQYSSAGNVSSGNHAFGVKSGSSAFFIYFGAGYNGSAVFDNSNSLNSAFNLQHGFNLANTKASTHRRSLNGSLVATKSEVIIAIPSPTMTFFGSWENGAIASRYNHTLRLTCIGRGLTIAQESALNSRIQTLVSAL